MNFDQFTASFQTPEGNARFSETTVATPIAEIVLAGTVLTATKDFCCIDINGTQYEIDPSDVIDIQALSSTDSDESVGETVDENVDEDPRALENSGVVLMKVNGNAVLWQRVPVQAGLVAAVGTWMSVVPLAPEAAATVSSEASAE